MTSENLRLLYLNIINKSSMYAHGLIQGKQCKFSQVKPVIAELHGCTFFKEKDLWELNLLSQH